ITAVIAGFFLDDVAEIVEREDYPQDPPGRALPMMAAALVSVKFLALVVVANLFALLLLLVPGVNIAAFFVVNGYLLGREFFEFAAMRFRPEAEAKALRRQNAGTVFLACLVIAVFLSVPLLNLLTPLFAAAMMVHLRKMVSARDARSVVYGRVLDRTTVPDAMPPAFRTAPVPVRKPWLPAQSRNCRRAAFRARRSPACQRRMSPALSRAICGWRQP